MGFTGVGKTTLSHILSGHMVKTGMIDDDNVNMPISAIDDDDERKIGASLIYSTTKVPNLFIRVFQSNDQQYDQSMGKS